MTTKVPIHLSRRVLGYAAVELSPRSTLLRFYVAMLFGAFITLLICPQFGVGPLGGGHGLAHRVMSYGAFACGAFCSALFVGAGTLCSVLVLSRAQWSWVWRHHFGLTIPPLAIAFIALMGIKLLAGLESIHETPLFYLAWLGTGPVTCWLILRTMRVVKPI